MISKYILVKYYINEKKSSSEISKILNCSENQVNYWIKKFNIKKRTISDSVYVKNNPNGDPFTAVRDIDKINSFIYGLGLGLYWGEGNKRNKNSIRLGNTDPDLIKAFIVFLKEIYKIDSRKLSFGIQIFQDLDVEEVKSFWIKKLKIKSEQIFKKVTISKSGKLGSYKNKCKYGVVTVYFHNMKLKKIIDQKIEDIRKMY